MDNDLVTLKQIAAACSVSTAAITYTAKKLGITKHIQTIGKRNYLPPKYADKIIEFYHEKHPAQDFDDSDFASRKTSEETTAISITLNSNDLELVKRLTPFPFMSVSDYCRKLVHADIKANGSKYERIVALRKETETEIKSLINDLGFND